MAAPAAPLRWSRLGDAAITIRLDDSAAAAERIARRVLAAVARLDADPLPGVIDVAPAFTTVSLFFDPRRWSCEALAAVAAERLAALDDAAVPPPRVVGIPVAYGGPHGPDLDDVAARVGLPAEEVVRRHAAARYRVAFIGFAPGFPYLHGLPVELAVPRLDAPRTRVPAGAVGIGGGQTGVYPLESPGGWRIIGRTPARLFTAGRIPAAVLRAGDVVRFLPVTADEWPRLGPDAISIDSPGGPPA